MESLINAMSGFLGAVLGALIAWLAGLRQARVAQTFELHREFNSADMIDSRYRASQLLERHRGEDYAQLRRSLGRVEMQDVWNIMYFYQRLWLAVRHGHVRNQYVPELFGEIFFWWWEHSFEHQLAHLSVEPAQHVKAFKSWMEAHSTEKDRMRWRVANEVFRIRVDLEPQPPQHKRWWARGHWRLGSRDSRSVEHGGRPRHRAPRP